MTHDTECRVEGMLNLPRAQAFSLFVDRLDMWWTSPFKDAGEAKAQAGIDPHASGSCYEIDANGQHRIWGTVLSLEPPLYIRLASQISRDGEEVADPATAIRM